MGEHTVTSFGLCLRPWGAARGIASSASGSCPRASVAALHCALHGTYDTSGTIGE